MQTRTGAVFHKDQDTKQTQNLTDEKLLIKCSRGA